MSKTLKRAQSTTSKDTDSREMDSTWSTPEWVDSLLRAGTLGSAVSLCLLSFAAAFFLFSAQMATKYSELELAINALVTEFHKAADDGPTMTTTQFQTMVSKQLPVVAKSAENEEALGQLLQKMGVQNGQNISFENFWALINNQATQMFGSTHKEKNTKCGCLQQ